jgi:hypothetical protein
MLSWRILLDAKQRAAANCGNILEPNGKVCNGGLNKFASLSLALNSIDDGNEWPAGKVIVQHNLLCQIK